MKRAYLISALFASAALPIHGGIFITEVDPAGSSAGYGADWLELTTAFLPLSGGGGVIALITARLPARQ
jgi:hypothetical protein